MNKKINILIISTRDIGKMGTIFEHAERLEKTSNSLKDYFLERNKEDELKKLVQLDVSKSDGTPTSSGNPNSLVDYAKVVFNAIKDVDKDNKYTKSIREYCNKITNGDALDLNFKNLVNLLKTLPNELKAKVGDFDTRFEMAKNTYTPGGKTTFDRKDFEDEKYLSKPAINTFNRPLENNRNPDGSEKPLTLRDRISLFLINDDNNKSNCIFAVLTLKKEDDDRQENKWVDSLTHAVIEELDLKDDIDINLIIMLHDKDLYSTSSETFKTVRPQEPLQINIEKDGKRTIIYDPQKKGHLKRTLIVFNHPNHFYRNLIIQKKDEEKTAKKIIEDIEKGTVYSLNDQHLKDISQQIATLKTNDDFSSIEKKYKEITVDNDIVERYKKLGDLLNSGSADGLTLIKINDKINEFIRYYSSLIHGTNDIY